eukprot:g4289.t1
MKDSMDDEVSFRPLSGSGDDSLDEVLRPDELSGFHTEKSAHQLPLVHSHSGRRGFLGFTWGVGNDIILFAQAAPPKFGKSNNDMEVDNVARENESSSLCCPLVQLQWEVYPRETRKLLQDGHQTFVHLQQQMLLNRDDPDAKQREILLASRRYRRCMERSIQAMAARSETKAFAAATVARDRWAMEFNKLMELTQIGSAVWHLCEFFLLDDSESRCGGNVTGQLVQWVEEHFWTTQDEEDELARIQACEAGVDSQVDNGSNVVIVEDGPTFWVLLCRFLMRGHLVGAHDLLMLHSHFRLHPPASEMLLGGNTNSGDEEEIAALEALHFLIDIEGEEEAMSLGGSQNRGNRISAMPLRQEMAPGEFNARWAEWRANVNRTLSRAQAGNCSEGLITALKLLSGDISTIESLSAQWFEMLAAELMYRFPTLQRQEFAQAQTMVNPPAGRDCMQRCLALMENSNNTSSAADEEMKRRWAISYLAIMNGEGITAIDLARHLGLQWMAAHLADLLHHARGDPLPTDKDKGKLISMNDIEKSDHHVGYEEASALRAATGGGGLREWLNLQYSESILGDRSAWQVAATYAAHSAPSSASLGVYPLSNNVSALTLASGTHARQQLVCLLQHHGAGNDKDLLKLTAACLRFGDEAGELFREDVVRPAAVARARWWRQRGRFGNCVRWLLVAGSHDLLEALALELMAAVLLPGSLEFRSLRDRLTAGDKEKAKLWRTENGVARIGHPVMQQVDAVLAAVGVDAELTEAVSDFSALALLSQLQQLFLVEEDIHAISSLYDDDNNRTDVPETGITKDILSSILGPDGVPLSAIEAEKYLHREAGRRLHLLLADEDMPRRFWRPLLRMCLPYLRRREFSVAEAQLLMERLEDAPTACLVNEVGDGASFGKTTTTKPESVSYFARARAEDEELRLEVAQNLAEAILF